MGRLLVDPPTCQSRWILVKLITKGATRGLLIPQLKKVETVLSLCRRLPKIPRLIMQTKRKRWRKVVLNIKLRITKRHKFRHLFKSNPKRKVQVRLSPLNLLFRCHTMALDRINPILRKQNLSHSKFLSKLSFHRPNLCLLLGASSHWKARDQCRSPETLTFSKDTIWWDRKNSSPLKSSRFLSAKPRNPLLKLQFSKIQTHPFQIGTTWWKSAPLSSTEPSNLNLMLRNSCLQSSKRTPKIRLLSKICLKKTF